MEKHARAATKNPKRSSAGIPVRAYWCEVLAEGEVYGTRESVPYILGTFQTISPKLALRWLQSEAERIADRPGPGALGVGQAVDAGGHCAYFRRPLRIPVLDRRPQRTSRGPRTTQGRNSVVGGHPGQGMSLHPDRVARGRFPARVQPRAAHR